MKEGLIRTCFRLHQSFVLLSDRLFSVFVEDVAGYIERKREAIWRRQCVRVMKSVILNEIKIQAV